MKLGNLILFSWFVGLVGVPFAEGHEDARFFGGAYDGYASARVLQDVTQPFAARFWGGAYDGHASARVFQDMAQPFVARFWGGAYDGYAATRAIQAAVPLVSARFHGGAYDGYAQSSGWDFTNPLDRDSDGSGLPDWWLWQYFGVLTGIDPDHDADWDGASNLHEFLSGTDPMDSESVFKVVKVFPEREDRVEVRWFSVSGKYYAVQFSTNLMHGFETLDANIPGTPPLNVWTNQTTPGEDVRFYRVQID